MNVQSIKPIILGLIAAVLLGFLLQFATNSYVYSICIYAGINVILAVSLNLVIGLAGQFSMGHAGFMAVGAYASAFCSLNLFSFVPFFLLFPISLLAGGVASALLGFLVGLPSLRLKGDYLAIVTLGFGEIIRVLILNIDTIGGARGLPGIPAFTSLPWVLAVGFLCAFMVRRLMASSHGRAILAVREDETAAEAMGVNTTRYKVRAFVFGSFFAGVAGGLFAHQLTYINPSSFDFNKSFEFIMMVVLGGMGSTSGAVLAALFLTFSKELLRPLQEITRIDLRMVIFSLMLIFLMILRPNGFFGTKEITHFSWFKRFRNRAGT